MENLLNFEQSRVKAFRMLRRRLSLDEIKVALRLRAYSNFELLNDEYKYFGVELPIWDYLIVMHGTSSEMKALGSEEALEHADFIQG
jgi:hypothetical protein